ncbi:MAG: hypothetical protein K8H88_34850, partial [Sandaracinaceae bacterium]|nr:hypothetical protein [Sandaracinaceae bacterium]
RRRSGVMPSAALTGADLARRYSIAEEQGRLLRSQEREDALRFIELYDLDDLDAAAALLYFHGLERRVVAALLGDTEEALTKRHCESLYRKIGVRGLRELRVQIAAFVADGVIERRE